MLGLAQGLHPQHSAPPVSSSHPSPVEHEAKHLGSENISMGLPSPPASAAPQPRWEPSPEPIGDGAALGGAAGAGRKEKAQGWLIQLGSYRAMGHRQFQKHPSDFGAEGLWHPNPFGAPPNALKEPKLQALPQETRVCPCTHSSLCPIPSTRTGWGTQSCCQAPRGWAHMGFFPHKAMLTSRFGGLERKEAENKGRASFRNNICAFPML